MSYYLDFSTADHVVAPVVSFTDSFTFEIDASFNGVNGSTQFILWNGNKDFQRTFQFRFSSGNMEVGNYGNFFISVAIAGFPSPVTDRNLYTVELTGSGATLKQNGTTVGSASGSFFTSSDTSGSFTVGNRHSRSLYIDNMQLYGLTTITDTGDNRVYTFPSSGLTLPEASSGTLDGDLRNFPADDSQWVFYSTGPDTPINPSVTNLLATSARLSWEQG